MVMGSNKTSSYNICLLVCLYNWIKSRQRCKWVPILFMANIRSDTMVLYE